jgi:ribosomal protein S18 acetylase RimI-like enzyme
MAAVTTISYVKRYKMEVDLRDLPEPTPPAGFQWVCWSKGVLPLHAEVMSQSFQDEIDGRVFPCLGDRDGCYRLMHEITRSLNFIPESTWLLTTGSEPCGTIQGMRERSGLGAIQNVGVLPAYRGMGVGSALLLQALRGFQRMGLRRAILEVTAENERAIQLYWRLGFRRTKTIYKAVSPFSGFGFVP